MKHFRSLTHVRRRRTHARSHFCAGHARMNPTHRSIHNPVRVCWPCQLSIKSCCILLQTNETVSSYLGAGSKRRPVGPAEENFDTSALASCLELASDRFCQSYLQDLNCLGLGSRVARLRGVESASNHADSPVAEHGSHEAQKVKAASIGAHCPYGA